MNNHNQVKSIIQNYFLENYQKLYLELMNIQAKEFLYSYSAAEINKFIVDMVIKPALNYQYPMKIENNNLRIDYNDKTYEIQVINCNELVEIAIIILDINEENYKKIKKMLSKVISENKLLTKKEIILILNYVKYILDCIKFINI